MVVCDILKNFFQCIIINITGQLGGYLYRIIMFYNSQTKIIHILSSNIKPHSGFY